MQMSQEKEQINNIIDTIMNMARGNYSVQVKLTGKNDDLDSLAMGLNMMVDDLKFSNEKEKMKVNELECSNEELQVTQDATEIIMKDLDKKSRELNNLNKQLQKEIIERKHAEENLQKRTHDLGERVKELNCINETSKFTANPNMSTEQVLKGIVELIPPAWQYPEITCARILFKEEEYGTPNWKDTEYKQSVDIFINDEKKGAVEVAYLEERPKTDEGPFVSEERDLIDALAREIEAFIKRKNTEDEVKIYMKKLEQKNNELDEYTYIVSHDLKAPLITIQGFADLLRKKYGNQLDEKGLQYIDNLVTASNNLNTLITDLLEYSRAGRKEIRPARISLKEAVERSLVSLQGIMNETGAKITVSDDLPEIIYDPIRLGQVLNNLLSNALKYSSPERIPEIEVGSSNNGEDIILWIRDNGMGMKKESAAKIFEPFVRLTNEKKGTGIGLSIVKTIVERHGGKIWVESEPGEGSTFYMTIQKDVKI